MGKQKNAQIKKQEMAEEMVLLLLRSFQKRKMWWNNLNAWKLTKIRTDLKQLLNEADHQVQRFAKTGGKRQSIVPTGDEDEE